MVLLKWSVQEGDAGGLDLSSDCQEDTRESQEMSNRERSLKPRSWGWQGDSEDKGTYHQAWQPKFEFQDQHDRRREPSTVNRPLTFT